MPWWALPAAALAFGVGTLLAGEGPPGSVPAAALTALAAGVGMVAAALLGRRARPARSAEVLRAAGVGERRARPAGDRARILAAAGFPGRVRPSPPLGASAAAVVGLVLLGAGWAGVRAGLVRPLGPLDGRSVRLEGTSAGDVRTNEVGWSLEVSVDRLASEGRWQRRSMRVWLSGDGRPPAIEAGQPVSGAASLRAVRGGDEGFEDYLRSRGVVATGRALDLEARGPPPNPAMRLANALRRGLRRGALAAMPRDRAGLLLGLSVGDTSLMDAEVERDFRATGLGHLVAVSGENVANQGGSW